MRRLLTSAVLVLVVAGVAVAYPPKIESYHVQTVGIGDGLDKVIKVFGAPQALQILGNGNGGGAIQILYFRNEDSLSISISDLPENKVVQIEVSGTSWSTDAPVRVGDRLDSVVARMGKPDKVDDLTARKRWMLEQAGEDAVMRRLIEKNSGDTGSWYQQRGLYVEYDRNQGLVKTIRIYDPLSELGVNLNKA